MPDFWIWPRFRGHFTSHTIFINNKLRCWNLFHLTIIFCDIQRIQYSPVTSGRTLYLAQKHMVSHSFIIYLYVHYFSHSPIYLSFSLTIFKSFLHCRHIYWPPVLPCFSFKDLNKNKNKLSDHNQTEVLLSISSAFPTNTYQHNL